MLIREVMSRDVKLIAPEDTIEQAARKMAEYDCGAIAVGAGDRLVGMITDRDIALRAVARGKGPNCRVGECMSSDVKYVFEDETTEDAARNMSDLKVRRLPVLNRDKRLVGIVSLGDLAWREGGRPAQRAIHQVSQPEMTHA
ncbi:MAG TPA: CBS domain-containing protein [Stellaceae bacterium]|nr:CBS domain-containing protein [Stellaceae bacterium]